MKHRLLLIVALTVALGIVGCKSQKQTVENEIAKEQEQSSVWQNVQMPVTVTIDQPMRLTLTGTMTMVRGEYVLVSFRTLGFEVATAYVTPEQMNMVMKMPSKVWISEPLADRLKSRNIDFTQAQDAMLSNTLTFPKMSDGIDISMGGTSTAPELSVSMTAKGVKFDVAISYSLKDAEWNVSNPRTFSEPGTGYSKLTLQSAAKLLGQ